MFYLKMLNLRVELCYYILYLKHSKDFFNIKILTTIFGETTFDKNNKAFFFFKHSLCLFGTFF